jgi:predicted membrane protein
MQKFPIHFCLVYNKRSINFFYISISLLLFSLIYLQILKNIISLLFSLIYLFTNIEKHKISKSQCAAFTDDFLEIFKTYHVTRTCSNMFEHFNFCNLDSCMKPVIVYQFLCYFGGRFVFKTNR